jgi:membrane-associated phospholipid phosphatase
VATALIMSRDGTMEPDQHTWLRPDAVPEHPSLDDPNQLTQWDPWVRATLVQSALNEGLTYDSPGINTWQVKHGNDVLFKLVRPTPAFLNQQLPLVMSWAELREERMAEILAQIDNQTAFIAAVTGLNLQRHPWTFEWLQAALNLVIPVEVRFKHALGCARPVVYSPQVQPIITTPGHGTYPMGHAAQAFMLAVALQHLLRYPTQDPRSVQLERQAARISVNRVVAGVHFPVDAHAGEALGRTLARFFLWRCGWPIRKPKDEGYDVPAVADGSALDYPGVPATPSSAPDEVQDAAAGLRAPVLFMLTELARRELGRKEALVPGYEPKKS